MFRKVKSRGHVANLGSQKKTPKSGPIIKSTKLVSVLEFYFSAKVLKVKFRADSKIYANFNKETKGTLELSVLSHGLFGRCQVPIWVHAKRWGFRFHVVHKQCHTAGAQSSLLSLFAT